MHNNTKLRGGRRHFHVILFILLFLVFDPTLILCQQKQTIITNETAPQDTMKYYTPEELEIWKLYDFITSISNIQDETERRQLARSVYVYGAQYFIDPILLLSIIQVESKFKKNIVGYGNCYGYFQINLNVHKVSKQFKNSTKQQTEMACKIYSYCNKLYKSDITKTLNAYNGNASSKNKYASKILNIYNNYKELYYERK